MSSEWQNVSLGDCVEITTGFPFKSIDYSDAPDGIRLLRGDNIAQGVLRWDGVKKWSKDKLQSVIEYELRETDIVLAMDRPWIPAGLKFGRIRKNDVPALLVQRVARIRPIQSVSVHYIYYIIASYEFTEHIKSVTTGTVVPHISANQIKAFKFLLPNLHTQINVGLFLSALDDRITLLRETNATLEAIAQALFKSWFVDFDPVHAKAQGRQPEGMDEQTAALFPDRFVESELGMVPLGWEVGTLGNLAITVKKQLQASNLTSDLNYVGLEHIPRKSLSLIDWGCAEGLESAKNAFSKKDILFGKLRPYFHKVVIAPFDGVCSTDILVCQSKIPSYYGITAMLLFSTDLISYAERLSNGAKMPRVNWKDLANYPICIPPEHLATNFTETITSLFSLMLENVHKSQTLSNLRDTLLPRLISGQLRLPDVEA
jgi:type I restriction enzyme S subunit